MFIIFYAKLLVSSIRYTLQSTRSGVFHPYHALNDIYNYNPRRYKPHTRHYANHHRNDNRGGN